MNSNSRSFAIILVISLMFNAFAVGLLLSDRFAPHHPFPGHSPPDRPHRPLMEDDRSAQHVRELFQELRVSKRKEFFPLMKSIRDARKQVQKALNADPFDAKALDEALQAVRMAEQAAAAHAHRTISELAAQLNPEERARLGHMIPHHRRAPRKDIPGDTRGPSQPTGGD